MPLVLLKEAVRIGDRIPVVEPGHESHGPAVLVHAVEEASSERARVERMAHRVDDASLLDASGGHLPDLLHTGRVDLRSAPFIEAELRGQVLRQRTTRALAQHRHLRADVRARLEVRLSLPVPVDPLVSGAHTDHPVAVEECLHRRHRREHVRARGLHEPAQPLFERAQGDDVVAVILERRGKEGEADLPALREVIEVVTRDVALDRRAPLLVVGHQLPERARIEHASGDAVGADLGGLLEHRDRDLAERRPLAPRRRLVPCLDELGELESAREARGAPADEEHVDVQGLALDLVVHGVRFMRSGT
jgi:hypothetical protein